jgi:hypothetical protein
MSRFPIGFILLVCLLAAVPAFPQTSSGIISGRVTDPQGSSVPAADVVLTQALTGVKQATRTDTGGDFVFPSVLPGLYTIGVEAPGFKRFEKRDISISASERLSVGTLGMEIGAATQSVTVEAEATPVQTTSQERSALLNDKQMSMISTQGRDYMNMLKVLPGVALQDGNGSQTLGTSGMPIINGGRNDYSSINVDGVVANNRGIGTTENEINLDAVAEVKVLMSNYQAEFGKNSGAVVNVVTKGGTQQFHGTAYWYKRHEMFNAASWINNRNSVAKGRYRYNTVGYNLGGPIYLPGKFNKDKDKLFFFFSQEHQPNTRPGGLRSWNMPTELERQGNFSQSLQSNNTLIAIKDPLSGANFPGNIIPANRLNPDTQKLLSVFPLPNFTDRNISRGNYNYVLSDSIDNPVRQELLRVDYNPTAKWRTYFRGMNMYVNNSGTASTANNNSWGIVQAYNTTNPNVAVNVTYMATPTLVNELSVGLSRWTEIQSISDSELARLQRDKLGIKLGQLYPKNNPLNVIPGASFGGLPGTAPGIGFDARFPMYDIVNAYSISDGLTKVAGAHTLKFGLYWEWAEYLQAHHAGSGSNFAGNFSFGRDTNNPFDTNHPYSNALLGYFGTYQEVTALVDYWPINHVFEWYAQDNWKVNRKLTLDYGFRFSYDQPTTLVNNVGGNFITSLYDRSKAPALFYPAIDSKGARVAQNPKTGEFFPAAYIGRFVPGSGDPTIGSIQAGTAGYPEGFMKSNGVLVAPRFGIAYDPFGDGKTAIRAGAGIFLNARPRSGQTGDMAFNPPVQLVPVQYYGNVNTFLSASGTLAPSNANKVLQGDAKLISSYNLTFGIQRNIGFQTVLDVAYVGTMGRHLGNTVQINTVPYGARFQTQNLDRTTNNQPLPDAFFRPYFGYGNLPYLQFGSTSNYHSMQTQLRRSFRKGLQYGLAWTWSRSMNYGDGYNDGIARYNDPRIWNYGPAPSDRTHTLMLNWVWDLPRASRVAPNPVFKALFDNWQFSGIAAFATGLPKGVGLSLSDGADLTGGGDGTTVVMTANPALAADKRTVDRWIDTSVFQRPARGQIGSGAAATLNAFRGPGVANFDFTFFKNIPVTERVKFQVRWEMYNAFNHTQFTGLNTTAQFDAAGRQINGAFGQVTGTRDPRIQQLSLRVSF